MASVLAAGSVVTAAFVLWLWHIDRGYKRGAAKGLPLSPHRWTQADIEQTCAKLEASPIDWKSKLPPAQKRRYIVVGGAGGVGGTMVLHLLARGQSPKSIRILDFRKPVRDDLLTGPAAEVEWLQTDVSSAQSTSSAFSKPWDESVADLPLTVFHTAALIHASWRYKVFLKRVADVNVQGTANVIAASKAVGADILITTSSGGIPVRPVDHWLPPWKSHHDRLIQPVPEPDEAYDIRDFNQYFSVYAVTKAEAEQLALRANSPTLKVGCIRPCNGIYGNKWDLTIGTYIKMGQPPMWHEHVIQAYINANNVSLAHLDYEAAMIKHPQSAGKTFNVTDAGGAITAGDICTLLRQKTSCCEIHIPSTVLLPFAYLIEWYAVLNASVPALAKVLPQLSRDADTLQPALWTVMMTVQTAKNDRASLAPEKGGIGYVPGCTTLEGMCQQILEHLRDSGAAVGDAKTETIKQVVQKAGASARN